MKTEHSQTLKSVTLSGDMSKFYVNPKIKIVPRVLFQFLGYTLASVFIMARIRLGYT